MSLLLPDNALEIVRGESKTLVLSVTQPATTLDGTTVTEPADLTGATVFFTVKRRVDDRDILIQKASTTSSEADVTSPLDGLAEIYLVPGDTESLDIGDYRFDVWVELASGDRYPVVKPSTLRLVPGVTRINY